MNYNCYLYQVNTIVGQRSIGATITAPAGKIAWLTADGELGVWTKTTLTIGGVGCRHRGTGGLVTLAGGDNSLVLADNSFSKLAVSYNVAKAIFTTLLPITQQSQPVWFALEKELIYANASYPRGMFGYIEELNFEGRYVSGTFTQYPSSK